MTEKSEIRKRILRLRDTLTQAQVAARSRLILERLIPLGPIQRASTLMVYLNFAGEAGTDDLIRWGLGEGRRIVVPRCDPGIRGLTACLIHDLDEVVPGHYGIREPKAHLVRPVPAGEIDAVLVPGVAFDRRGYRIGYGGGYYDRFLPESPQAARIGIAFACQIVEQIPVTDHDIPMDRIVTDEEIIVAPGERPGFFP